MILILGSLPPGPDEGVLVPGDRVVGRSGLVDGEVGPVVAGVVDPGLVGPGLGRHWLMHPQ